MRRKMVGISLLLLVLLAAVSVSLTVLFSGGYERIIGLNWDLDLPRSSGCLYEKIGRAHV